jgi:uncharacterized membrane protein
MAREEVQKFIDRPRDQRREVVRIEAFSDGVYAIAITLLALQLEVPTGVADLWAALRDQWPGLLSFIISFAVIGAYWVAHHRLFALIERSTSTLLRLNLFALFFIALQPFTTSLVGTHGQDAAGQYEVALTVYALSLAAAGLSLSLLAVYALGGHRCCAPDVPDDLIRYYVLRGVAVGLTFVISLALLPLGPSWVEFSWLSLLVTQRILSWRVLGW